MTENLNDNSDHDRDAEPSTPAVPALEHQAEHQVEVRRNVPLSAGVGSLAALLTAAFAVRAFTGGTALDWLAFGVLSLVTVAHLAALVDSRAPLLVADQHGVRLRRGALWQGIAWPEIDCLEHLPRRGLLRDGHILVDGYDDQQLVVPLTLATRLVGATNASLSDVLADLADGRADVVEVVPGLPEEPRRNDSTDRVPAVDDLDRDEEPIAPEQRRGIAARVAAGLMTVSAGPRDAELREAVDAAEDPHRVQDQHDQDYQDYQDWQDTGEIVAVTEDTEEIHEHDHEAPSPGRATVLAARVEIDRPSMVRERLADPAPPVTEVRPTQVAQAEPGEEVTVVLDHLAIRGAANPVIGPQLSAARERLRLTVDQISERTRIRPHVVEAIEADDFGPCGGDFYARGHLRTLARVLGIDAAPLIATFDEVYAQAPVDPRRVFESELARGAGGAIRSTRGGRNWSVLVAGVMAAILVWSVAQLVMNGPVPVGDTPVLNQSGGVSDAAAAKGEPVQLTLTAAGGGAQLVVRDGAGEIVFDGDLAFGQTSELKVVPPVRIWSSDGSVTAALDKRPAAPLGEIGSEVSKTLVVR